MPKYHIHCIHPENKPSEVWLCKDNELYKKLPEDTKTISEEELAEIRGQLEN